MTVFLPQPSYGSSGPDGRGWNRLNLGAHFEVRHQCGLLPVRFTTLWESMTGRQRWGGYERCTDPVPGDCTGCPVQRRHLEPFADAWPAGHPALLARIRPLPPTPGATFADPAAGRSTVDLTSWLGRNTVANTGWVSLRNTPGLRVGWSWRDEEGEAFWTARDNPAAATAAVRSKAYEGHTRHALYAAPGAPRLALVTCHGGCAHDGLGNLAADLAAARAHECAAGARELPEQLRGVRDVCLEAQGASVVVHRAGTSSRITVASPAGPPAAAVLAHAVRLGAAA
ncbi:hypothetical protein [Kitasatospora sp. NPDC088783]|uniref:hypothetical protein n=1 Tax=Kitasatospora sp. NPDC088783 TaxID=3364077 RepID=UPI003801F5A5